MSDKPKKLRYAVRFVAFLLVFCGLFYAVNSIAKRKTLTSAWNTTTKIAGLTKEPKNTMDVMFFGSSHMYCTVNPLEMFHQTGITSYVYAVQNQPLWGSYYYVKEALKYQSPKVVVLDIYPITLYNDTEYTDESVNFPTTDELTFSRNKIDLIQAMVKPEDRKNHYIEFLKYHERWKELKKEDFDLRYRDRTDYLKGYVMLPDINPQVFDESLDTLEESTPLSDKNAEYLSKLIDLSKERNFQLVFLITPYKMTAEERKIFNSVQKIADDNGIPMIDYNLAQTLVDTGINMAGDFYDTGHLNVVGAAKVSRSLGQYLANTYDFADKRENPDFQNWQWDYTTYDKARQKAD